MYECMRERVGAADWCVAAPRTVRLRFQTDNWLKVLSTPGLFLAVNGRKRVYLFLLISSLTLIQRRLSFTF